jgi:hypothetical protein
VIDRASRIKGGRPGLLFCNACRKQFSVTVGTVFERSKIPLHTWLYATNLLCSSKKGISSCQLERMLGVSHKTAWFMAHRIRAAMAPAEGSEPPLGGEGEIVEADETELGVSHKSRARKGGRKDNLKFVSLIERGGKVRSRTLTGKGKPISIDIHKALYSQVDGASILHTDGAKHYAYSLFRHTHEAVDHNKQFVRDGRGGEKVHCNSAEGYFSIFKRGLVGTYQHMKLGYSDDMRTDIALEGIGGKRLTYRRIGEAAHA